MIWKDKEQIRYIFRPDHGLALRLPSADATDRAAVDRHGHFAISVTQHLYLVLGAPGEPGNGPGIIRCIHECGPGQEWSRWWRRYCAGADAGPSCAWRLPRLSMPQWAGRCASAPFRRADRAAPAFPAARAFRAGPDAQAEPPDPAWPVGRKATTKCCGRVPATGSAAQRRGRIRYPRPGRARRPRIRWWWGNWWMAQPEANVILVTGRVFDVLDVPANAGAAALALMERSAVRPGPVAISAGNRALVLCGDPRHASGRGRMVVLPPGLRARDEPGSGRATLALPQQLRARAAVPGREPDQGALAAAAGRRAAAGRAQAAGVPGRRLRGNYA